MHRNNAGKAELMLQDYHCNNCNFGSHVQFQSDGFRRPPNQVACARCKKPIMLPDGKWTTRTTQGPVGIPNKDG